MSITIQEGKYYRTRDGRKVGPLTFSSPGKWIVFIGSGEGHAMIYEDDGRPCPGLAPSDCDLIAEWVDEPSALRPVDFSKIRAGDKVRLGGEFVVDRVSDCSVGVMIQGARVYFGSDDLGGSGARTAIVGHISASKPIEVGCLVTDGATKFDVLAIATIGGLDLAWIKKARSTDDIGCPVRLSDLQRIDDGEAA